MVFGFGKDKKKKKPAPAQEDTKPKADAAAKADDEEEEDVPQVLFQGALNGKEANLVDNAKLAKAGLVPAKQLISDAVSRRANAVRIDPQGDRYVVGFFIDGVKYPGGRFAKPQGLAITQILKLLSGLDIKERQKPQSGGVKARYEEIPYEIKVESKPTSEGAEQLVIRLRNLKQTLVTPDEVGLPADIRSKIRELSKERSGLIVTCGSAGSGTTTTALAVLTSVDAFIYSMCLIADTEGRSFTTIPMFEMNAGDTLEATLMRCIRKEMDVVYLGHICDAETVKSAFKLQLQIGLMGEMAASDAANAIAQLVKWAGDPAIVSEGLKAVITQKLMRKLCTKCRQAYRPNPKLLEKLGLPEDTRVLYRPRKPEDTEEGEEVRICRRCGGLGYLERVAMFELIPMTDSIKAVLTGGGDAEAIKAQIRKDKLSTLQKEGLRLVADGTTSLEELQRVFKG